MELALLLGGCLCPTLVLQWLTARSLCVAACFYLAGQLMNPWPVLLVCEGVYFEEVLQHVTVFSE